MADGHVFVTLAAIEKLKQSEAPAVRKLAAVLEKHRWVKVYDDVIAMIAKTWADAAPAIAIEP